MAIDGINTRQPVYKPVRTKRRKSSELDKVIHSDEANASQHDRNDEKPDKRQSDSPDDHSAGGIDERV